MELTIMRIKSTRPMLQSVTLLSRLILFSTLLPELELEKGAPFWSNSTRGSSLQACDLMLAGILLRSYPHVSHRLDPN